MTPIPILLADDHAIVRQGLRAILETEPGYTIVAEAADGLEALELTVRLLPAVLVLDLMMPSLNGLDSLRVLRRRSLPTRVVVFSMCADEAFVVEALQCGALGYILKGGQTSEIVTAVAEAVAGRHYLSPPLRERGLLDTLQQTESAESDAHELLTPRELQVFQLAAEGKTCADIAIRLHLSPRTIEMHRFNFMHKLGLRSQTDLVRYALQRGTLGPTSVQGE